jgi:hypothetical protein
MLGHSPSCLHLFMYDNCFSNHKDQFTRTCLSMPLIGKLMAYMLTWHGYHMVLLRCNQHKPQNQTRKFKRNGCCNFYVFNTWNFYFKCFFGIFFSNKQLGDDLNWWLTTRTKYILRTKPLKLHHHVIFKHKLELENM